jgi:hypothetical protein
MADTIDIGGLKAYLRRKFTSGGGGVTFNGIAYAATEAGIKAFADAVFLDGATDTVIITQNGFEGGYATGSKLLSRMELLSVIEELIGEFGFGSDGIRQMMVFADYSQGMAST